MKFSRFLGWNHLPLMPDTFWDNARHHHPTQTRVSTNTDYSSWILAEKIHEVGSNCSCSFEGTRKRSTWHQDEWHRHLCEIECLWPGRLLVSLEPSQCAPVLVAKPFSCAVDHTSIWWIQNVDGWGRCNVGSSTLIAGKRRSITHYLFWWRRSAWARTSLSNRIQ